MWLFRIHNRLRKSPLPSVSPRDTLRAPCNLVWTQHGHLGRGLVGGSGGAASVRVASGGIQMDYIV